MNSLFLRAIPLRENIPVLGFGPALGGFPGPFLYPFFARELSSDISSATSEVQPV